MKKNSRLIRNSGAYTSPGTPEYVDNNVGDIPKSWSSERVPLPTSSSRRRHASAVAFMPFNSGKAWPSKWDDAERWITSPISSYGSVKNSIPQHHRRPKSKSGPLGPPGLVYLSSYSPNVPTLEGGKVSNFMANSPLTTGVLEPDGLSIHYDAEIAAKSNSLHDENSITQSTSVPGLSELINETSMPSPQDGAKEEEALDSWGVNHRDVATQMSPEGSTHSSSRGRLSFSNLPSSIPTLLHENSNPAAKDEVRDVQVDKGTTTARQFKKQGLRKAKKGLTDIEDLHLPWNSSEASKNNSKLQREEAKITAWENLQKAKAEAAIRKLEMKLEKKKSSSMDKILNKFRASLMKAQAMRNSLSENHAGPARKPPNMGITGCIHVKLYHRNNCFPCRKN